MTFERSRALVCFENRRGASGKNDFRRGFVVSHGVESIFTVLDNRKENRPNPIDVRQKKSYY